MKLFKKYAYEKFLELCTGPKYSSPVNGPGVFKAEWFQLKCYGNEKRLFIVKGSAGPGVGNWCTLHLQIIHDLVEAGAADTKPPGKLHRCAGPLLINKLMDHLDPLNIVKDFHFIWFLDCSQVIANRILIVVPQHRTLLLNEKIISLQESVFSCCPIGQ